MKLTIKHQENYSRGELLLRVLFGWLYIALPHMIILYFIGIWSFILTIISFFSILFRGVYPRNFFEFQAALMRWKLRLFARIFNLADGYPAFGINATDDATEFYVEYPEKLSKGLLLLKVLLGWLYVGLPHGLVLMIRALVTEIIMILAFFAVLFTGKYPESWHTFVTGYIRWTVRVSLYMMLMTDEYPPFTGKKLE